jgi:hypothetical protein
MGPSTSSKQAIGGQPLRRPTVWNAVLKELLTNGRQLSKITAPPRGDGLLLRPSCSHTAKQGGRADIALNLILGNEVADGLQVAILLVSLPPRRLICWRD